MWLIKQRLTQDFLILQGNRTGFQKILISVAVVPAVVTVV